MSINKNFPDRHRNKIVLEDEDFSGDNMYENTWLPVGDEKKTDIIHLLQQNRISK